MNRIIPILLAIFILSLGFADIAPALACSGGGVPTLTDLLESSDYLVKAHPVEIDGSGQNYILRVESYLSGGAGPEFLLYSQLDPRLVQYIYDGRSSGGDCLGLPSGVDYGETFYAFLTRTPQGYYRTQTIFNETAVYFADDNIYIQDDRLLEGGESLTYLTEAEFIDVIVSETDEAPIDPLDDAPYPRKAPLTITTASGQDYLLPIDTSTPIEITPELEDELWRTNPMDAYGFNDVGRCETEGCMHLSPDGTNISVQDEDETITLSHGRSINGQASLFSSTSDAIAVWQECFLTVYSLGIPRLGQAWHEPEVVNVASLNFDIQARCTEYANLAAWSPDGRLLAFSDNAGLWLWDVFTFNEVPELLIPTENDIMPLARYFSPMGRYLSMTVQGENQTLDLISGDVYPDGVISPDDRLLVNFNSDAEFSSAQLCSFTPYTCEPLPASMELSVFDGQNSSVYTLDQIRDVRWLNQHLLLIHACNVDDVEVCAYFEWYKETYSTWWSELVSTGYTHDYDAVNDSLAIARDANTLYIDGEIIDLSGMLDSDIASVEWGYSLFYRE